MPAHSCIVKCYLAHWPAGWPPSPYTECHRCARYNAYEMTRRPMSVRLSHAVVVSSSRGGSRNFHLGRPVKGQANFGYVNKSGVLGDHVDDPHGPHRPNS